MLGIPPILMIYLFMLRYNVKGSFQFIVRLLNSELLIFDYKRVKDSFS